MPQVALESSYHKEEDEVGEEVIIIYTENQIKRPFAVFTA